MRMFAAGLLVLSAGPLPAAPARMTVEHLGQPRLDGQALPFSDAVRVGDMLYLSGQIGITPDGKLPDGIDAQTRQMMNNIGAILKRGGVGYDRIIRCTAMLSDMKDWPAFNKIYVGYFPDGPLPARSAFDVDGLALGALVELECTAYAGKR